MVKTSIETFSESAADKMCVAHIHHTFFAKSETFIYQVVSNLKRFHPLFLAWDYQNLDQFPIPPGDCWTPNAKRGSWQRLLQGLARRLLRRELPTERFLKQRQVRLLHAHFGPNGVWALRLKRAIRLPLVTTFYGYDLSHTASLADWEKGYQSLFQEGDLFLVEGPHMKAALQALGCPGEKIAIQRIAIPLNGLPFRPRLPKNEGEKVILVFSGRFVEKKGLLIALQALIEVRKTHPLFEFRVIGDGPLRPEIEQFIQARGMGDYVRLLGFLGYHDYLEQMKGADLFLHPSITAADGDSEGGAPTTILEAQALGLPVISTRHADIPNVVVPDLSALLSDEGDIAGLAANIISLLTDGQRWSRMGADGRRFIETFHDVEKEIPRLESIYASLIESNGKGKPC